MLFQKRKLLLAVAVGSACATTGYAQELLLTPAAQTPPPAIGGVEEAIPEIPATPAAVQNEPAATTLSPVPDNMPATVRISDCPQNGEFVGGSSRRRHDSPTAGWVAPAYVPMHRMWVPYYKFFPNPWVGQAIPPQVRLPVIYTPTDTTQLGYYYQHVPHWHTYANMIPPVPRPVDWHYKHQTPRVIRTIRQPTPATDLGEPQPMPETQQPAPPPPQQNLDKSAAAPELQPLVR